MSHLFTNLLFRLIMIVLLAVLPALGLLTILKESAERRGGRAWVESGPEGGTTFRIPISKDV